MNARRAKGVRRSAGLLAVIAACLLLTGCFPIVLVGAGATAMVAADRRSAETQLADEIIERNVARSIESALGESGHVNATCYNKTILLTGEVPDGNVRDAAGKAASSVAEVKTVDNELIVGWRSRVGDRANDVYLDTKVYTRFLNANRFQAKHVKVVSEYRVVYLLGLVTRKEADDAVEIARTTGGVEKVVSAFEYLSEEEAARIDTVFGRQDRADKSEARGGEQTKF
jgi:osmotically-inducible protein OsmY